MKEQFMETINADEKIRRITVAMANWLCGVLEGNSRDKDDIILAEALDSWLRRQKQKDQTLYSGHLVCNSCGHEWECMVFSSDTQKLQCPQCGIVQTTTITDAISKHQIPENKTTLEKVQMDAVDVVSKIAAFNQIIKDFHTAKDAQS
jgi:hypothetical protein